ncbi:helix-turn-helix transcriptional regulator [Aquitalea sp.]|uniref:helix-turn-helix domain-containing protein n=1 Tax=Aquitalea sp. TaxID=1872623 RepID=UPI00258E4BFC|nr:helix-turn-helix transcriptional regulator [Aquitalea sp.]
MGISVRLSEERNRLGLNQTEAAKAGDISFTAYQNYERGDRAPNAETLQNWATAGFNVLYVVTGTRNNSALSNEQSAVLEQFGKLDDKGRAVTLAVMQAYNAL